jgi:hypothetical protein
MPMIASAFPTNLRLNGESGWKLAMGKQSTHAVSIISIKNLFMDSLPFRNLLDLEASDD